MRFFVGITIAMAAGLLSGTLPAAQPSLTTLHSFTGGEDGASPFSGLIAGPNGSFYGTTIAGGTAAGGTIYQLLPPAKRGLPWTKIVLYNFQVSFNSADGFNPVGNLILADSGSLYGVTQCGGLFNGGTVYQLSPPTFPGGNRTETPLYSFRGGSDGAQPAAAVVFDSSGALYGTTVAGGASKAGTVFQLTPPVSPGAPWTEAILYTFTGLSDGGTPFAPLILGPNGALYGTTANGGFFGKGTVFEMTPPEQPGGTWSETVIHTFATTSAVDGLFPHGGLVLDSKGNLYGTTQDSKGPYFGTLFELTPQAAPGGVWTETIIHEFRGPDGTFPVSQLVMNAQGVLFGNAPTGGLFSDCPSGCGTVFGLQPPAMPGGRWVFEVLYHFQGQGDGSIPLAGLTLSAAGLQLYGTTIGQQNELNVGTIFQITL